MSTSNNSNDWQNDFDEAAALICALPDRFMFEMCDLDDAKPIISSGLHKSIIDDHRDNVKANYLENMNRTVEGLRKLGPTIIGRNPLNPLSAKEFVFSAFVDQSLDETVSPFQWRRSAFDILRNSFAQSNDEEIQDLSGSAINFYAHKYADYVLGMNTYIRVASYALLCGKTLEEAVEDGHLAVAPAGKEHVIESYDAGEQRYRRVFHVPSFMKRIVG